MAETYQKIDNDTLQITNQAPATISTTTRAEIQTKIDHLELQKQDIQLKINKLQEQITILEA